MIAEGNDTVGEEGLRALIPAMVNGNEEMMVKEGGLGDEAGGGGG